jgi:hypothetical protein
MYLIMEPPIIPARPVLSSKIWIRVKESSKGQILYSFWCPDIASAEKEVDQLRKLNFCIELAFEGEIMSNR